MMFERQELQKTVMVAVLFKKLAAVEVPGNILLQLRVVRMDSTLQTTEVVVRCAMGCVTSLLLVMVVV